MAERRIRTIDGQLAGIGDEVWTENHRPWIIVKIFDQLGSPWVAMKTRYEQSDLDSDFEIKLDWSPGCATETTGTRQQRRVSAGR